MSKAAWMLCSVLAWALSTMLPAAVAQDNYPSRPIRMLVTSTPGGTLDIVGRILAQKLAVQMNTNVVVENRPSENGNFANALLAKSWPDGYTLAVNSNGVVFSKAFNQLLGYDLLRDLAPISLVSASPFVMVTHPSVPAGSLAELVTYVKTNPGKLAYGSTGMGSIAHLGTLLFLQPLGLSALHVPYKGGALVMNDILGGRLQFTLQGQTNTLPFIKDKRIAALAITSRKRSPLMPDVPTFDETGMPLELSAWQAVMAVAKTPPAIVKKLNAEILKALQDPNVKSQVEQLGAELISSTPEEFGAFLKSDLQRWTKVIKDNNIKLE